jgi:hypothetical protein
MNPERPFNLSSRWEAGMGYFQRFCPSHPAGGREGTCDAFVLPPQQGGMILNKYGLVNFYRLI